MSRRRNDGQADPNQEPNQPEMTEEERKKLAAQERLRSRFGASLPTSTTELEAPVPLGQPSVQIPVQQFQPSVQMQPVGYQVQQQPGQQVIYVPVQQIPGQVQPQPAAPPAATVEQQQVAPSQPVQQSDLEEEELAPPLYKQFIERPPAEWMIRDFDKKYQKGGYTYNPLLVGAVEAIGEILEYKKYKIFEEMFLDFLGKYNQLLEDREDVVRLVEEKYKMKHDLYTKAEREKLLRDRLKELKS